ncbi:MAG: hypothetical protein ACI8UO_002186 [Verrucomicrobiales bacterium]|jgi:hypothetical protein
MQLHIYQPPEPEPEIYSLGQSSLPEELWRSVDIALLGVEATGPILFDGGAGDWKGWIDGEFSERVAKHLVKARKDCAGGIGIRELTQLDADFDQQLLADEARIRSVAAGKALLLKNNGARQVEPISKFSRQIESGACSGHAASVFALQATLFNLSVNAMLTAYLCLEWRGVSNNADWKAEFERLTPDLAARMPGWLQSGGQSPFQPRGTA